MKERFEGEGGRRLLLEALHRQSIIRNDQIAERLANAGRIEEHPAKTVLIRQSDADNDIYFIFDGEVSIEVNGRFVASRKGGQHVGEMALIDPVGRRTASVVAQTDLVCLKVDETAFSTIADDHPRMWRALGAEVVERFRQRGAMLKAPNETPRVFIGSSAVKGLPIAEAIQAGLSHTNAVIQIWTQGVFTASRSTIEALEEQAASADFAILVLSADDAAEIRGKERDIPRDNVIFELGLFLGALGRERTYMVVARGSDLAIPTDILGVTPLEFAHGDPKDLQARIGPVCTEIKKLINQMGPK